ncbi:MAG: photosystem II reaction center PsbP family protein [Chloroflexi bacterium]|nr:photosystem II reaction center PsbP family protein [Chloroflexota bacterium]MCC6892553.1 hypothetical protein [Anaerolineae bacterium]
MKTSIGLLVLTALSIAACNLNPTGTPTAQVEPTTASASSSSSVPMTTQVDEFSGVAFDYPTGWTVSPPPAQPAVAYSYSLGSFDFLNPSAVQSKSDQGVPDGETVIQVNFHAEDETLESIRGNLQSEVSNGTGKILKEQSRTMPDGAKAYYYEIQGMFEGTGYLLQTTVNGHTVSVVAYGEGDHFEDVVNSLRVA